MQSAVDYFMNSLNAEAYTNDFWSAYKKAKEREKEQLSECYTEGFKRAAYIRDLMSQHLNDWNEGIPDDFETYYEKTYGNNTWSED